MESLKVKIFMKYGRWLVGCGLVLWSLLGSAAQPLPPDQAFHFSTVMRDSHTVVARWAIAPGYYLYRDHFNFSLLGPNGRLGTISLPPGIPKQDEFMGKYQVYENSVAVTLPLVGASAGPVSLKIGYQGCSAAGFCYPPVTKQIDLTLKENFPLALASAAPPTPPQQDRAMLLLANSNVFLILLGFFGFGLLLAFTPCVLPMVPILSGIILGQTGSMTVARAFSLSLAYVIAMATT